MADKVLFAWGSGVVGQRAAKAFRARHPNVPILIGGRDIGKAEAIAKHLGNAEAVQIDTGLPRLGLEQDVRLPAIAMMVPDAGLPGMLLAQNLGTGRWMWGQRWPSSSVAQLLHPSCRPVTGTAGQRPFLP